MRPFHKLIGYPTKSFRLWSILALLIFLTAALNSVAEAGLILQPVAASTDMGEFAFPTFQADNTRNQSGFSANYTSLVDDFDTVAASTASGGAVGAWMGHLATTGNFDFDLGGSYTIESFAFWNLGDNLLINQIQQFNLLADDNSSFSSPTFLGSFIAPQGTLPAATVYTFLPTLASYVRLEITLGGTSGQLTGFNEGAFEVSDSAVPEPSTLLLLGTGLVGAGVMARRRRKQ